ncbi:hypothetical protein VTL71DRAFT_13407 [Oculimacula yallundae]|uniref:Uncharacterized protein n=1 Tax=Oculimacula yallundae TaxID=86028 RepID=A0ABR4CME5_9HELO
MTQSELLCGRQSFLFDPHQQKPVRKQRIMTRGKLDPDCEGVFVGVHGEIAEEEKAAIKKKREGKSRPKGEGRKQRETELQQLLRTIKTKAKSVTDQVTAHLATVVSRTCRARSPHQGASKVIKHPERPFGSSLEGIW